MHCSLCFRPRTVFDGRWVTLCKKIYYGLKNAPKYIFLFISVYVKKSIKRLKEKLEYLKQEIIKDVQLDIKKIKNAPKEIVNFYKNAPKAIFDFYENTINHCRNSSLARKNG